MVYCIFFGLFSSEHGCGCHSTAKFDEKVSSRVCLRQTHSVQALFSSIAGSEFNATFLESKSAENDI